MCKSFWDKLASAVFVDKYNCIICDRELRCPNRLGVCSRCYASLTFVTEPKCLKCGKPLVGEGEYCTECKMEDRRFDKAFAPLVYTGDAASMVLNLKFHGRKYLAKYMAAFMTDAAITEEATADVVIPVPLHETRLKERGYNQSELLASGVSKALNIPVDTVSLSRIKATKAQSELGGKDRRENIMGAFDMAEDGDVMGKSVLLVDDVLTTGATASECAETLKKAGAKSVVVLTFATVKEYKPIERE